MPADNSQLPNLSECGYEILRELGHNRAGGRVTYLAVEIATQTQVVIKDFQFARADSSWSSFNMYQQEIEVLQKLEHPGIPRYLHSFETESGFCLVQEYKPAATLNEFANFTVAEIRIIAIEILKILVYLQSQHPLVIHRDIKPENILVERLPNTGQLKVYLIDFGFARLAGDVTASSVVKGTLGFMPPEQIFNRELTCASDLYSLGMTLICLLTRTKSADAGKLLDENYCVDFTQVRDRAPEAFADWLELMVSTNSQNRYKNAAIALEKLTQPATIQYTASNQTNYNWNWLFKLVGITVIAVLFGNLAGGIVAKLAQLQRYEEIIQTSSVPKARLSPRRSIQSPRRSSRIYPNRNTSRNVSQNIQQLKNTRSCRGCYLQGANLQAINLVGVNLEQADLSSANLQGSNLRGANLRASNLSKAQLQNSYLGNANLNNAKLEQASLRSANLENVQLRGANLNFAELEAANLKGANLSGARLRRVNFRYAILRNAAITVNRGDKERLKGAMLPDGTIHP